MAPHLPTQAIDDVSGERGDVRLVQMAGPGH